MTRSHWNTLLFWIGAILVMVLATLFYQPAAAKTGSLLVWLNNRIYVMDIDTLNLERVGPALRDEVIVPSPGCYGLTETPCWVTADENLYAVRSFRSDAPALGALPVDQGYDWIEGAAVSWAPDGRWLAYPVFDHANNQAELRLVNVASGELRALAGGVDPELAPAWSAGCAAGLDQANCQVAYKTKPVNVGVEEVAPKLVALDLPSGAERSWEIPAEPIFELQWTASDRLLYSRPKRHFRFAEDGTPAYAIPRASQLANMSPAGNYTVYYQPFTLADCPAGDEKEACMHVGVWLIQNNDAQPEPRLIYSTNLSKAHGGLNFVPVWSPLGHGFVFFQEGQLIYYDLQRQEAAIWHKSLGDKLRSVPVFSPNEEAVALVDNAGQGFSEYRLVVVNPRLQPIEHIIDTKTGFRVLAWLPN